MKEHHTRSSAGGTPSRTRQLLLAGVLSVALVAGAGARIGLAGLWNKVHINSDAGMNDAQRTQGINDARQQYRTHYAEWLAGINIPKLKLGGLTRLPILGQWKPSKPTLQKAVRDTDVIVGLTANSFNTQSDSGSVVGGQVTMIVKGSPTPTILIQQQGGLRPTPDWQGITIADAENEPLVLPGDQVILFLSSGSDGKYEIQSFSGMYRVVNGLVQPLPGNAFGDGVAGLTVPQFVALITTSLQLQ
jgi:hypothetical protein